MRAARLIPLLAAGAVLAGGCGGGSKSSSTNSSGSSADGKQVFATAGCGSCHALQAAGSTGTIGPEPRPAQADARPGRPAGQVWWGRDAVFRRQALGLRDRRRRRVRFRLGDEQHDAGDRHLQAEQTPAGQLQDRRLDVLSPGLRQLLLPRGARRRRSRSSARRWPPTRRSKRPATPSPHSIGAGALLRYHGNVGKAFGRGRPDLRLRLLPRPPAVEARRRHARQGRERRAQRLLRARRSARTRTTTTSASTVSATA